MFAFGELVTVEAAAPGTEDAHGNSVQGWGAPVVIDGWGFDPGGSVETFGPGRDLVRTSPKLYRQSNDFIPGAGDRITVRGLLYQVDGDTADWRSPLSGWQPGIVVNLQRVSG